MSETKNYSYSVKGLKAFYGFLLEVLSSDKFPPEFQLKQIQNFCDYVREGKVSYKALTEEFKTMDPYNAILTRKTTRLDNRHYRLIRRLLKNGLSPNIPDSDQEQPLVSAVNLRDPRLVELLLTAGANSNCNDGWEQPILHVALRKGNIKIIKLLLTNGANPNAPSSAVDFSLPIRPLKFIEAEYVSQGGKLLSGKNKSAYQKFKKDIWSLAKALHQAGGNINYKRYPKKTRDVTPLEKAYAKCEKDWELLLERMRENEAARASAAGRAR